MRDTERIAILDEIAEDAARASIAAGPILRIMHANEGLNAKVTGPTLHPDERDVGPTSSTSTCACGRELDLTAHEFVECECGRVTSADGDDPTSDPVRDELHNLDKDLRSARRNLQSAVDRLARWQRPSTALANSMRGNAAKEIAKKEAKSCEVHKRIGEPGVEVYADYSVKKLCRQCGLLAADLAKFPQVAAKYPKLADKASDIDLLVVVVQMFKDRGRVGFVLDNKMVADLLGIVPGQVKMPRDTDQPRPLRPRQNVRTDGEIHRDGDAWHTASDYELGDNLKRAQ